MGDKSKIALPSNEIKLLEKLTWKESSFFSTILMLSLQLKELRRLFQSDNGLQDFVLFRGKGKNELINNIGKEVKNLNSFIILLL